MEEENFVEQIHKKFKELDDILNNKPPYIFAPEYDKCLQDLESHKNKISRREYKTLKKGLEDLYEKYSNTVCSRLP